MRPGFKETELGLIPENWELRPLLTTVRIANGQVDPRIEPYREMILVAPDHIESGTGRLLSRQTAGDQRAISGKYVVGHGDIVYSKIRPYLRKAVLAEFDGLCSADMYPLKPAVDVSGAFMLGVLLGHRFTKYAESVSVRSGMPKINRVELADFAVALPPLPEQQAIATALSDVDALLDGLNRLIAKKRDLKQAAMQQLLTGRTRLPGFHGEWEEKQLGTLGTWRGGMTPSMQNPNYWEGGDFPWISSGDVKISRLTNTSQYVTSWAIRCGAAVAVPANSVVLVTRSGILRKYLPVALAVIPMAINQDIKALVPADSVSADYLLHALTGFGADILASCLKTGTTVESVEFPWLKAFGIPMPPRQEQTAIAAVLSDMDAELAALVARRDKTRDLKQAMMQELLTGKTRLVPVDGAHA